MFKFKDLSDKDEEFNVQDHLLTPRNFFEKRRKAKKVYVFDLRSSENFETTHLPGAHNLPFEHFERVLHEFLNFESFFPNHQRFVQQNEQKRECL